MAASDHLSPDQFLDLYHHTTPERAAGIMSDRRMTSDERGPDGPEAFFTTSHGKDAQAGGRGNGTVHVRVPDHIARLDDEFPDGEQHYAIPVKRLRPSHFVEDTDG